jgi:hypothetical protein
VKKIMSRSIGSVVLALSFTSLGFPAQVFAAVHAVFELSTPATGPFPSDQFTVPDASHNTRRRVSGSRGPEQIAHREGRQGREQRRRPQT